MILVVLGAWAGLALLVGPYFRFGYSPDRTWDLTQGRLYLSVVPGAVALLAGLVVAVTRNRIVGGVSAVIGAIAGTWLIVGFTVLQVLPVSLGVHGINPGLVIDTAKVAQLDPIGAFTGPGALIIFFAALALGRFSLVAPSAPDEEEYTGLSDLGLGRLTSTYSFPAEEPTQPGVTRFPGQPEPPNGI